MHLCLPRPPCLRKAFHNITHIIITIIFMQQSSLMMLCLKPS